MIQLAFLQQKCVERELFRAKFFQVNLAIVAVDVLDGLRDGSYGVVHELANVDLYLAFDLPVLHENVIREVKLLVEEKLVDVS